MTSVPVEIDNDVQIVTDAIPMMPLRSALPALKEPWGLSLPLSQGEAIKFGGPTPASPPSPIWGHAQP